MDLLSMPPSSEAVAHSLASSVCTFSLSDRIHSLCRDWVETGNRILGTRARHRRGTGNCLLWVRTAKPTGNRVVYSACQSEIPSRYGEAGYEAESHRRFQSSSTATRPSSEPPRAVPAPTRRLERKTVSLVWAKH